VTSSDTRVYPLLVEFIFWEVTVSACGFHSTIYSLVTIS